MRWLKSVGVLVLYRGSSEGGVVKSALANSNPLGVDPHGDNIARLT